MECAFYTMTHWLHKIRSMIMHKTFHWKFKWYQLYITVMAQYWCDSYCYGSKQKERKNSILIIHRASHSKLFQPRYIVHGFFSNKVKLYQSKWFFFNHLYKWQEELKNIQCRDWLLTNSSSITEFSRIVYVAFK